MPNSEDLLQTLVAQTEDFLKLLQNLNQNAPYVDQPFDTACQSHPFEPDIELLWTEAEQNNVRQALQAKFDKPLDPRDLPCFASNEFGFPDAAAKMQLDKSQHAAIPKAAILSRGLSYLSLLPELYKAGVRLVVFIDPHPLVLANNTAFWLLLQQPGIKSIDHFEQFLDAALEDFPMIASHGVDLHMKNIPNLLTKCLSALNNTSNEVSESSPLLEQKIVIAMSMLLSAGENEDKYHLFSSESRFREVRYAAKNMVFINFPVNLSIPHSVKRLQKCFFDGDQRPLAEVIFMGLSNAHHVACDDPEDTLRHRASLLGRAGSPWAIDPNYLANIQMLLSGGVANLTRVNFFIGQAGTPAQWKRICPRDQSSFGNHALETIFTDCVIGFDALQQAISRDIQYICTVSSHQLHPESNLEVVFRRAASKGDVAGLKLLLMHHQNEIKIHAASSNGNTALHWAAMTGNAAAFTLLLQAGLGKNDPNKRGKTPMMLFAEALAHCQQPKAEGDSEQQGSEQLSR